MRMIVMAGKGLHGRRRVIVDAMKMNTDDDEGHC